MKADCGGAAATLGAFEAALEIGVGEEKALHLILCLAENAIGPVSAREREHTRQREEAHAQHIVNSEREREHTLRTLSALTLDHITTLSRTSHHSIPFTHTFHHSIHSH